MMRSSDPLSVDARWLSRQLARNHFRLVLVQAVEPTPAARLPPTRDVGSEWRRRIGDWGARLRTKCQRK